MMGMMRKRGYRGRFRREARDSHFILDCARLLNVCIFRETLRIGSYPFFGHGDGLRFSVLILLVTR